MSAVSRTFVLAAAVLQVTQAQTITLEAGPGAAGFGTPSSGLTQTLMVDNALAWVDLAGAKFKNVPPEVTDIATSVPSAQVTAGSKIRFDCPSSVAGGCQGYVWFYACPAKNCVAKYQGGVPSLLASTPGWVYTLCAPHFVSGIPSGYVHQMRGYRFRLSPGDEEVVTVPAMAEFLAFGLETAPEDCSAHATKMACEDAAATTKDRCLWNAADGKCVETICKRGGQGPPPPCGECPWKDLAARDPSDGP